MAFHREQKLYRPVEFVYLTLLSLVEFAVYRWIIVVARITGTLDFLRGVHTYDRVPRARTTGTLTAPPLDLEPAKV